MYLRHYHGFLDLLDRWDLYLCHHRHLCKLVHVHRNFNLPDLVDPFLDERFLSPSSFLDDLGLLRFDWVHIVLNTCVHVLNGFLNLLLASIRAHLHPDGARTSLQLLSCLLHALLLGCLHSFNCTCRDSIHTLNLSNFHCVLHCLAVLLDALRILFLLFLSHSCSCFGLCSCVCCT